MKQLYTQTTTQNPKNIQDVNQAKRLVISYLESVGTTNPIAPSRLIGWQRGVFSYLAQNKGKGPPGRQRSPGYYADHPPDSRTGPPDAGVSRPASPISSKREGQGVSQNTIQFIHTEQTFLKNIKTKFYLQLNFTIMKKQILFLAFFILAVFAGMNKSYGQYSNKLSAAPTFCPPATPIGAACATADALHPIPGTLYPYTVTVTNGGTAPTIHWFVTDNPNFIVDNATTDGGGDLTTDIEAAATSDYIQAAGASYNVPTNTSNTVDITWKYFPSTTTVFLVAYVKGDPTCTDNIQVYKIQPSHAFTLDIAALTAAGAENTTKSDCVSPVVSAIYTAPNVVMDYGVNYVYFTVNAANFAHSWLPSFQVTADNMGTDGTLAVDWAYPSESTGTAVWHPTTGAAGIYTSAVTDPVKPITTTATGVGAAGECIVVRVTVDHNKNETLANITLNFAANGVMYNFGTTDYSNALLGDLHHQAGAGPTEACPWVDMFTNDKTTYTLTRRPTIVDATTPPAGDDFIPKN